MPDTQQRIHPLALIGVKKRLSELASELSEASVALDRALAFGDLSENSEYDAAKETMRKLTAERDLLTPLLTYVECESSDSTDNIDEGCIIELWAYGTTPQQLPVDDLEKETAVIHGKLMFGGAVPGWDILNDHALGTDTPVGHFLVGKRSGSYSIQVKDGFVRVRVKKLPSTGITANDLFCEYAR